MRTRQILEKYVVPAVALLSGLMFLIAGVTKIVKVNTFPQTKAVITRIEWTTSSDPDTPDSADVYVRYTVGGSTYDSKLDNYKNSYREGKEISVRYNPGNPMEVSGMGMFGAVVIFSVGVLFSGVGVGLVLRMLRNRDQ